MRVNTYPQSWENQMGPLWVSTGHSLWHVRLKNSLSVSVHLGTSKLKGITVVFIRNLDLRHHLSSHQECSSLFGGSDRAEV